MPSKELVMDGFRQRRIEDNLEIPKHTADKIRRSRRLKPEEYEDLVSEGNLELCRAADAYRESDGDFASFAGQRIAWRQRDWLRRWFHRRAACQREPWNEIKATHIADHRSPDPTVVVERAELSRIAWLILRPSESLLFRALFEQQMDPVSAYAAIGMNRVNGCRFRRRSLQRLRSAMAVKMA